MGLDYLYYADNDYAYFMHGYERGDVFNGMASLAQNACEKYLKHLIELLYVPQNEREHLQKRRVLSTHNLINLTRFLRDQMGLPLTREEAETIEKANGYYINARYPGDDSIVVTAEDVERCAEALSQCKKVTERILTELQENNSDEKGS